MFYKSSVCRWFTTQQMALSSIRFIYKTPASFPNKPRSSSWSFRTAADAQQANNTDAGGFRGEAISCSLRSKETNKSSLFSF